eukprot:gnl/TRDRNA2_/TRDRNA2_116499_c0_seq2.p2 gnl/TRDRNA2_/TRDRNA2_116499_c0~~gnl/TRDRNA2_/TRDRNA2_116499_c0_seq2.p2  ORF type:complete len:132 (-),score=15.24 gnl/TRDRNA2_/TRDRNA2_116499_c0_seq2:22-360(-)
MAAVPATAIVDFAKAQTNADPDVSTGVESTSLSSEQHLKIGWAARAGSQSVAARRERHSDRSNSRRSRTARRRRAGDNGSHETSDDAVVQEHRLAANQVNEVNEADDGGCCI